MMEAALVGTCHCGRVRITLPGPPAEVTQCNCSLCSKTGFQGIYYPAEAVTIEGEFEDYVRADSNPAFLSNHRCKDCGTPTHWTPLAGPPHERIGINARLFEPGTFNGVPVKHVDGRSWPL